MTDERAALFAGRLWDAALAADEAAASRVAIQALEAGVPAEEVLLDVIGAVQRRVGAEWAADRISVAQEHAATAINERAIAAVSHHVVRPPADRGRLTVACLDGEWHALPARLLAEVLTLRGFRVDYLGAQVPTPHLITHLHRTSPDVVALSGSLATRLPAAHATITACQSAGVPVIVGGAAFGSDGRWARVLGADAWAPDARTAADRLADQALPRPRGPHQPVDALPHLLDQEYTLVSRSSASLVRSVYAALEQRVPAMQDYTDLQRQHTAEDLAHIVEFLAAALYVDDPELFIGFATWTIEVLRARGVPSDALLAGLELLTRELRDLPRAVALISTACAAVRPG